MVLVVAPFNGVQADCGVSPDWVMFLHASGYFRLLPRTFRSKRELEHKLRYYMNRGFYMPQLAVCPQTHDVHYPDVLQFAIVWFLITIPDIEIVKIPPCMHMHLLEHTRQYAKLLL
ncbi:unnamed protein product [Cuscuta epithymum]|uniref:Uncharacterized protein n=1 Tax=Cuscuta epithymum TaxID=186058 RepID=A0AAV0E0E6_9ASTE|nr:unnamed protein product [Cuscuta epithymum]